MSKLSNSALPNNHQLECCYTYRSVRIWGGRSHGIWPELVILEEQLLLSCTHACLHSNELLELCKPLLKGSTVNNSVRNTPTISSMEVTENMISRHLLDVEGQIACLKNETIRKWWQTVCLFTHVVNARVTDCLSKLSLLQPLDGFCTKGIHDQVTINTLDQHLDWYSINIPIHTWLILDQQLLESWPSVDQLICIDRKISWLSTEMLMECWPRCRSSVKQGVDGVLIKRVDLGYWSILKTADN